MANKTASRKRTAIKRPPASQPAEAPEQAGAAEPSEPQAPKVAPKRPKPIKPPYTRFKRLENRQKAVEQNRRAVYAHLDKITHENIKLAKKGNAAIAKFLFEFAGINQLPAHAEAAPKTRNELSAQKADDDPSAAVLSFYSKLGMTPPKLKPKRPVAADDAPVDELDAM